MSDVGGQATDDPDLDLFPGMYQAFNAGEFDVVLEAMHPDVDWANVMEGGRVQGREQVRAYWGRVFAQVATHLEPEEIERLDDGRIAVLVSQVVRDAESGLLLSEQLVRHLFTVEGGLITRFDVEDVPAEG